MKYCFTIDMDSLVCTNSIINEYLEETASVWPSMFNERLIFRIGKFHTACWWWLLMILLPELHVVDPSRQLMDLLRMYLFCKFWWCSEERHSNIHAHREKHTNSSFPIAGHRSKSSQKFLRPRAVPIYSRRLVWGLPSDVELTEHFVFLN